MAEDLSPELLKAALQNLADQGVELIADDGLTEQSSVDETDDFLEAILAGRMKARGQWAVAAGNYTMVGDTVPELPPGYYDLASSQGQLYFVPVLGRTDKLIRFPHRHKPLKLATSLRMVAGLMTLPRKRSWARV